MSAKRRIKRDLRRCRIRTGGARRAPRRQAWRQEGMWSGSVGRILCAVAGVTVIPLGPRLPGGSSHLPARSSGRSARSTGVPRIACLFDVAPDGVWPAITVASDAVSSYLAISPLPRPLAPPGRFVFCATFRRLGPAKPACCAWPLASIPPVGVRTFLQGLRPSDRPTRSAVTVAPVARALPEATVRRRSLDRGLRLPAS